MSNLKPSSEILAFWYHMGWVCLIGGGVVLGEAITIYRDNVWLYIIGGMGLAYCLCGGYFIRWSSKWSRQ